MCAACVRVCAQELTHQSTRTHRGIFVREYTTFVADGTVCACVCSCLRIVCLRACVVPSLFRPVPAGSVAADGLGTAAVTLLCRRAASVTKGSPNLPCLYVHAWLRHTHTHTRVSREGVFHRAQWPGRRPCLPACITDG